MGIKIKGAVIKKITSLFIITAMVLGLYSGVNGAVQYRYGHASETAHVGMFAGNAAGLASESRDEYRLTGELRDECGTRDTSGNGNRYMNLFIFIMMMAAMLFAATSSIQLLSANKSIPRFSVIFYIHCSDGEKPVMA